MSLNVTILGKGVFLITKKRGGAYSKQSIIENAMKVSSYIGFSIGFCVFQITTYTPTSLFTVCEIYDIQDAFAKENEYS